MVDKEKEKIYKHYDRGHSYDNGVLSAYARGERPYSYWTKKALVEELSYVIDHSDYTMHKLYTRYFTDKSEVKKKLAKVPVKTFKNNTLKRTGTHKTGNYYQNTSFYRVLAESELPNFVEKFILVPPKTTQLKLITGVQSTRQNL